MCKQTAFIQYNVDMWQTILDILFPPRGRRLVAREVSATTVSSNTRCTLTRSGVWVNTCTSYTDESVRALVHALKFDGSPHAHSVCAQLLADALAEHSAERAMFGEQVVIVNIPGSTTRTTTRGHDHVAELARAVSAHTRIPYVPLLTRTRDTQRQMGLPATKRLHNMHDAFACNNMLIPTTPQLHVIVIDDVVTTGATLSEATRALRTAGVDSVSLWAVAHA